MKTKKFDCVKFKRDAQRNLWSEYQQRKDEFDSYFDFIEHKAEKSEWARKIEKKFGKPKSN